MKSLLGWCVRIAILIGAIVAFVVIAVLIAVRQSLPDVDGKVRLEGLAAEVRITRDALGVPAITAKSREDAARAMGFTHAQERFFQMDLLRRAPAGELSELFGSLAVNFDKDRRLHRFRAAAKRVVETLSPRERAIVEAYAAGVNEGLSRLGSRPLEYWILRAPPAPWKAEDSILVGYAMWLDLQESDGEPDLSRAVVRDAFSSGAAAFLLSPADPLEAAIDGSTLVAPPLPDSPGPVPDTVAMSDTSHLTPAWIHNPARPGSHPGHPAAQPAPSPSPTRSTSQSILDLLLEGPAARNAWIAALPPEREPDYSIGSNSWAVAGSRAAGHGALVANDMHLGLRIPHIWYRATMNIGDTHMSGVTLPGTPVFIIGSNGHVAWGFTNSEIDTSDVVIVEPDPSNPTRYITPDGPVPFDDHEETINVKGGASEKMTVRWTRWGPLLGRDHRGRLIALLWAAHRPGSANLDLLHMEEARDVPAALRVAHESGLPNQNFIAGDANGSIAWTIAGRVPRRVGFDGSEPVSLAHGGGWDGWLSPDEVPVVVNPPGGMLWSANARVVGGRNLEVLGDGGYAPASRARRIRDRLVEMEDAKPSDMLALQLDTRAILMDFWRDLLVSTLTPEVVGERSDRAALLVIAAKWNGKADADSVAYRLISNFRRKVSTRVSDAIFARCVAARRSFSPYNLTRERIVRTLVTEKPAGWLPPGNAGWDSLLLASADETIAEAGNPAKLGDFTWGAYNRLNMRHPLSAALPVVGRWLDMPRVAMSGDGNVVNALLRGSGPSERMIVPPGDEAKGILEMPAGESGNPLSPHYRDLLPSWLKGEPAPLLPGAPVNNLLLTP